MDRPPAVTIPLAIRLVIPRSRDPARDPANLRSGGDLVPLPPGHPGPLLGVLTGGFSRAELEEAGAAAVAADVGELLDSPAGKLLAAPAG